MSDARWAQISQLTDKITKASHKFLFLDKNRLDTSYKLLGDDTYQVGWGGTEISDAQGRISERLTLTLPGTFRGAQVSLWGNDKLSQWPTEYTIQLMYKGQLQAAVPVVQAGVEHKLRLPKDKDCDSLIFNFTKVNTPGTTVKILEIDVANVFPEVNDTMGVALQEFEPQITVSAANADRDTITGIEDALIIVQDKDTYALNVDDVYTIYNAVMESTNLYLSTEEITKPIEAFLGLNSDTTTLTGTEDQLITIHDVDRYHLDFEEVTIMENIHTALTAPVRTVYAKVRIKYTLDDQYDDSKIVTNVKPSYNSDLRNLINGYRKPNHKYAYVNETRPLSEYTNEMFHPMDAQGPDAAVSFPILSDANGKLATPLEITITHSAQHLYSLWISGDDKLDNYPTVFDVEVTDKNNRVVLTESITNNERPEWSKRVFFEDVVKIRYVIYNINKAHSYPKIQEVSGAVVEEYERDEIISLKVLEETSPETTDVSLGAISANQAEIVLLNNQHKFSFANSFSPINHLLKANREITVFFGAEVRGSIEWVQMGKYYSGPWKSKFSEITTSILANDRFSLMSDIVAVPVMTNTTLAKMFIAVLLDAGLNSADFYVDPSLEQIKIPYGVIPYGTHMNALSYLAKAAACDVFCDRLGKVVVSTPWNVEPPQKVYATSEIFDYVNTLDAKAIVNDVTINYKQYQAESTYREIIRQTNLHISILPGEERTLYLPNDNNGFAFDHVRVELTPNNSQTHFSYTSCSWGIIVKISNSSNVVKTINSITAQAIVIEQVQQDYSISKSNNSSIIQVGRYPFETQCDLIQTTEAASAFANSILKYYSDYRPFLELDSRGDFAVDLGGDVLAPKYDNYYKYDKYRQVRTEHHWDGTYRANITLEYRGGME